MDINTNLQVDGEVCSDQFYQFIGHSVVLRDHIFRQSVVIETSFEKSHFFSTSLSKTNLATLSPVFGDFVNEKDHLGNAVIKPKSANAREEMVLAKLSHVNGQ